MPRFLLLLGLLLVPPSAGAEDFELLTRHREPAPEGVRLVIKAERWKASETAVVVCDMWDLHHCRNAVERVGELVPRMNRFVNEARRRGALIVHAPSSCMEFYADHPARKRAQSAPPAANLPAGIGSWLTWLDKDEEEAGYPIDDRDGGCDDDPATAKAWAAELSGRGRNPRSPWKRQVEGITIDPERDAITDDGVENWNLLEARGVKNVMLVGVHTNMCVLGRPFGLRQMVRHGKNVVLVRDLTDSMYNPASRPFTNHYHGTDLVVGHIETHVCPTITSEQLVGGTPFAFSGDRRPHLVFLIGEREYRTEETVPAFAEAELAKDFRLTYVFPDSSDGNRFPGIEAVASGDALFVSVRRRTLPPADLALVREHVGRGKPVIGIRTASHAWSLRGKPAPEGLASWDEWDATVIGGNYTGHHGNKLKTSAWRMAGVKTALFEGVSEASFATGGSLYRNTPLKEGATVLMKGKAEGIAQDEPVMWIFRRKDGGTTFYTSLGHPDDFRIEAFRRILANAVRVVAGRPVE